MIEWREQRFSEINTEEFYEIFKFRSEVFVVEQKILYNDFDYKDYKAIHLSGFINDKLMAYARICLLYTSPSPRDNPASRMPSSA